MSDFNFKEIPNREGFYTYRCKICGFECVRRSGLPSGLPITKVGDYGANGTPPTTASNSLMYQANTISFTAPSGTTPATINDSAGLFADNHFGGDTTIVLVTGSGTNDGTYTIASKGVTLSSLSLASTDSLTTESAAVAGLVKIYRVLYFIDDAPGCPLCHSLNSR